MKCHKNCYWCLWDEVMSFKNYRWYHWVRK
jgi:hypothetical protein